MISSAPLWPTKELSPSSEHESPSLQGFRRPKPRQPLDLTILWNHLDDPGSLCLRTLTTGKPRKTLTTGFSISTFSSKSRRISPLLQPDFFLEHLCCEEKLSSGGDFFLEHLYDHFKAALLARFHTTDPFRDARVQLASLKQTKSVRAYSSAFRTTVLSIPDLSSAEALDRCLRGSTLQSRCKPCSTHL